MRSCYPEHQHSKVSFVSMQSPSGWAQLQWSESCPPPRAMQHVPISGTGTQLSQPTVHLTVPAGTCTSASSLSSVPAQASIWAAPGLETQTLPFYFQMALSLCRLRYHQQVHWCELLSCQICTIGQLKVLRRWKCCCISYWAVALVLKAMVLLTSRACSLLSATAALGCGETRLQQQPQGQDHWQASFQATCSQKIPVGFNRLGEWAGENKSEAGIFDGITAALESYFCAVFFSVCNVT